MFGMQAAYFGDRIVAVFGDDTDSPAWNGLLLPVVRDVHLELCAEFLGLTPHPVLGKWLFLPALHPEFESQAERIVRLIRRGDQRFGVVAQKKRKSAKRQGVAKAAGRRKR
jgi:hypothetical protein